MKQLTKSLEKTWQVVVNTGEGTNPEKEAKKKK